MIHIGRVVEPVGMAPSAAPFHLEPRALRRHAVCLGMTGSGKTGLCTALLEEVASARVPVIVIDPKGDMTNLALAFRHHSAEDLLPWIDEAAARRKGRSVEEQAEHLAGIWQRGLARDGVTEARVAAFVDGVEVSVYTPGSASGISVDVLGGLSSPPEDLDEEGLVQLAAGTASGLLGLVGLEADPVADPEHIVLARLIEERWRQQKPAGLDVLIPGLVDPPFAKVGVFPVDTFFPRKERMKLALALNGIVASPSFSTWTQGVPLDVDALYRPADKTPLHIFYTAHLDEAQRLFFTSVLLERVVAWSRRQPGTSGLRALLYFDEVFGYLPPHPANPPTKRPVLTLLKQARAVGLGVALVSQNPVDLDYKALSNCGLWMVGRLQTRQDRERVVQGLAGSDCGQVASWLEDIPPRTFVIRSITEDHPQLVYSRHVISYLRGPLTLRELERLPGPATTPSSEAQRAEGRPAPTSEHSPGFTPVPPPAPAQFPFRYLSPEVVLGPDLGYLFGPCVQPPREDGRMEWVPALHARLHLHFDEGRSWDAERREDRLIFPLVGEERALSEPDIRPEALLDEVPEGLFAALPDDLDSHAELASARKELVEQVLRGETERMYRHRGTQLESRAGETREAFEARVTAALEDQAHAAMAKLLDKVRAKVDRLEARQSRLDSDIDRYRAEARSRQAAEAVNAAEVVMGMFFGRRRSVSSVMSKRQQTQRSRAMASKRETEVHELQRDIAELQADLARQMGEIEAEHRAMLAEIEEIEVGLEKNDIRVEDFGILWIPVRRQL